MPKRLNPETPEEQSKRFRDDVQRLIDAGELSPTEAGAAVDRLVRAANRGKISKKPT